MTVSYADGVYALAYLVKYEVYYIAFISVCSVNVGSEAKCGRSYDARPSHSVVSKRTEATVTSPAGMRHHLLRHQQVCFTLVLKEITCLIVCLLIH